MTIKEVAQQAGISHQALYKKLKSRGIKLEDLKDPENGQLSERGEQIVRDVIAGKPDETQAETRVENSSSEIEKLRNKVEYLEAVNSQLIEERDFLKNALNQAQTALDQAQKLYAITLQKMPVALPAPEKRGIRGWFSRRRGNKDHEQSNAESVNSVS